MSLKFVITVCINNDIQLRQTIRCLKSIRQFHEEEEIYLLNDTDLEYFEKIKHHFSSFNKIKIIPSYKKGLGEQQVFYFILENTDIEENDTVVYIHDSVIILKSFDEALKVEELKFIWYFSCHRILWDYIVENHKPYDVENGILTHTQGIIDRLNNHFNRNRDFLEWALDAMKNKDKWVGCFGYMCIVKKWALRKLDEEIPFAKKFLKFAGRRDRIINESVFSLICNYKYSVEKCIETFDGLYFDGYYCSLRDNDKPVENIEDELRWISKGDYIGKLSFER